MVRGRHDLTTCRRIVTVHWVLLTKNPYSTPNLTLIVTVMKHEVSTWNQSRHCPLHCLVFYGTPRVRSTTVLYVYCKVKGATVFVFHLKVVRRDGEPECQRTVCQVI
jgi:hypothetical protein